MKYDVLFRTPKTNTTLTALVESNVGRAPDVMDLEDDYCVLVWRCDGRAEAEQTEARVKAALYYTIGVQPVPEVDSGALPSGSTTVNPHP